MCDIYIFFIYKYKHKFLLDLGVGLTVAISNISNSKGAKNRGDFGSKA